MTERYHRSKINRRNLSKIDYDNIEHNEEKKRKERRKRYMEYFKKKMEESSNGK